MTLGDDTYRAAVVTTVAASIQGGKPMSDVRSGPERRRMMRVDVPRPLRGRELEPHFVHLLNLSALGARVTHLEPWHEGTACAVDLPPALGVLRLSGRVVWTRLRSTEQTLAGDRWDHYESGIEFTNLTPAQEKALAAALATLQAAQPSAGQTPSA